jgi:hypothetical protein
VAVSSAPERRTGALALEWREVLAAAVLAGMVAIAFKLAIDAAAAPNGQIVWSLGSRGYPGWMRGVFDGLGQHLDRDEYYGLVLALCGLWAAAWALGNSIRLSWALSAAALLHLVFALSPPVGLSDVFNYVAFGRLAVVHGLDPYVNVLAQVPGDPAFPYATWPVWTNPYGPLATLSFYPLAGFTVPQALWLVKLSAAATGLGCAWLVAVAARRLGRAPAQAVVLVALNPMWLVYGVGGAHVDLLLALALVAAIYLLGGALPAAAGAGFVAAAAVKLVGGLALPFALVGERRRALAAGAAVAALAIYGAALGLWGTHLLGGVADQREVTSPRSVPGLVGRALGHSDPPTWLTALAGAAFAAAALTLLWRTWRGMPWIDAAAWATVALLLAITWLMPWYLVWLLPLAALSASSGPRVAALALTVFVVVVRWLPALS